MSQKVLICNIRVGHWSLILSHFFIYYLLEKNSLNVEHADKLLISDPPYFLNFERKKILYFWDSIPWRIERCDMSRPLFFASCEFVLEFWANIGYFTARILFSPLTKLYPQSASCVMMQQQQRSFEILCRNFVPSLS